MRKLAADQLFESFTIADDMLSGRELFFDDFTAADAHFFWCFRRATQLILISQSTQFASGEIRHYSRMALVRARLGHVHPRVAGPSTPT
jgi:hypothetical protein